MWKVFLADDVDVLVNDRVFVIGLDFLYREEMKLFETRQMLPRSQKLAQQLNIQLKNVPVEGYYPESPALTQYFKTMRALQEVSQDKEPVIKSLPEYEFIMRILTSGLFGEPVHNGKLLPVGRDPLSKALKLHAGNDWNIPVLMESAYQFASGSTDFSLVSLAIRTRDPVVVTALRESAVLYAEIPSFGIHEEPQFRYIWQVSPEIERAANQFIQKFNQLTSSNIPVANANNAETFTKAFINNEVIGRCVRIGDSGGGPPYYHWAIYSTDIRNPDALHVEEFWDHNIITTDEYRFSKRSRRKPETIR